MEGKTLAGLQEHERPVKLASGMWNCSVRHYASFHQHLACNLKTECEDGRDETGACPYSSPPCQGKIALCGRCYSIVDSLHAFVSNKTDVNERGKDYCNSIGGQLSIPKCVVDLISVIQSKAQIHRSRLNNRWTGLYTDDLSVPSMYIPSIIHEDRTVLHHVAYLYVSRYPKTKLCIYIFNSMRQTSCNNTHHGSFTREVYCEFQKNETTESHHHSKTVYFNSVRWPLLPAQKSFTECSNGHVTHTFLLCGSNQYKICGQESTPPCLYSEVFSHSHTAALTDHPPSPVPTFPCSNDVTKLSYTVVCDFITDCPDESDESFCQHPSCVRQFRCTNGQCVSVDKVCDYMFHCWDQSDEQNCETSRARFWKIRPAPIPAIFTFDGRKRFISTPMNSSESCPDSHYRCPDHFNSCLPVYTRCNSMYDCIDHQDEEGCEEVTCSGLFRCRLSKICLHNEHVCDGWPHCPMNDDEMSCGVICPTHCLCQGHTFLCPQPFLAAHYHQLRYLDASGSGMALLDVKNNSLLITVVFARCSIHFLPRIQLLNLKSLDLSGNAMLHVNMTSFLGLENLRVLSLSDNPLTSIQLGLSPVSQLEDSLLTTLDLSDTTLTVLETTALSLFPKLQKLNLTSSAIHTISPAGFQITPQLTELYMGKSPIKTFPRGVFKALSNLRFVFTENYKLCCNEILPYSTNSLTCIAPKDEISSCEDLLQSWTYRGFLWLIACLSLVGNVFCCCARLFAKSLSSSSGFSVFVTNLTIADFFMGVYITIIGVADERFRGRYLYNDDIWKHSVTCKVAGFLSLLSSEVSALIIWFITLDRFIVLHFPFSTIRLNRTSAAVACLFIWLTGWFLAMLPLLPVTSHWEFYSQTGICIPLPVTRREFRGRIYSFSILIVLNFIIFVLVSIGQALIYWTIQGNAMKTESTKVSREMTIARRLITIAVTDFLCWFPIGLCAILAASGVPIPEEINVLLVIFVLPLNSAINPFMYTFNTLAEKRRKNNETKLREWLENHPDVIVN